MDIEKLSTYLSEETMNKISIHSNKSKDDMIDEDLIVLNDGTCLYISSVKGGLKYPEGYLLNPNNIYISSECMIIVKYKEHPDDTKLKNVRFKVISMLDLESQWKKYRDSKNLGNIYGIISEITMTKEQTSDNIKIVECINQCLNIMLQDKVEVFLSKPTAKSKKRYKLINTIMNNIVNNLVGSGAVKSLYCPFLIRNEEGTPISIKDRVDFNYLLDLFNNNEGITDEDEYE